MFKEESECPGCVVARVDPSYREGDVSVIVNRCKFHRTEMPEEAANHD